jgi:hypothetical protein
MSPRCDLIVWFRDDDSIWGFQLCYDKDYVEHAVTWIEDRGYNHMKVDKGPGYFGPGTGAETPFLVADGVFDPSRILELFRSECDLVPAEYVELVSKTMEDIAAREREG